MDVRQFRQFCQRHSVLVAKLSDRLSKDDLLALVLRGHAMILDYYPWTNNHGEARSERGFNAGGKHDVTTMIQLRPTIHFGIVSEVERSIVCESAAPGISPAGPTTGSRSG
jgi:hypothetical protein